MPETDRLINKVRWRLNLARWAQIGLIVLVTAGFVAAAVSTADLVGFAALVAAGLWIALAVRAARVGRLVREASAALALGRVNYAEQRAREAADSFSLLRPVTLGAMQVLAGVAQRQGRPAETARLAAFVLSRPERSFAGDKLPTSLQLADALLALGQVESACQSLLPLYGQKLRLPEALQLLFLQLRVEAKLGDWGAMLDRIESKVDLCELMPPAEAAQGQALLLRAAEQVGETQWADWLRRRVTLLSAEPSASDAALEGQGRQERV